MSRIRPFAAIASGISTLFLMLVFWRWRRARKNSAANTVPYDGGTP